MKQSVLGPWLFSAAVMYNERCLTVAAFPWKGPFKGYRKESLYMITTEVCEFSDWHTEVNKRIQQWLRVVISGKWVYRDNLAFMLLHEFFSQ